MGSVAGAGPIRGKHAGGPDWARTTLMERIALIEVKLYQKANAYHHKTYAVYNGAHGPIRPPASLRHPRLPRRRHPPAAPQPWVNAVPTNRLRAALTSRS